MLLQMHITKYVWRVDYAGICILIICSFYPVVYYGFLCHPGCLLFYLASTTVMGESLGATTGAGGGLKSLNQTFASTSFIQISNPT